MAYSAKNRRAMDIRKLERQLKNTRSNMSTQRNRLKKRIADLRAKDAKPIQTGAKEMKNLKKGVGRAARSSVRKDTARKAHAKQPTEVIKRKPRPAAKKPPRKPVTHMSAPSRGMQGIRTRRKKPTSSRKSPWALRRVSTRKPRPSASFDRGNIHQPVFDLNR